MKAKESDKEYDEESDEEYDEESDEGSDELYDELVFFKNHKTCRTSQIMTMLIHNVFLHYYLDSFPSLLVIRHSTSRYCLVFKY